MKTITLIIISFVSIAVTFANDDVAWIKSGGNVGVENIFEAKISNNPKYFILREHEATKFIDIESGNLIKTYTNYGGIDFRVYEDFVSDSLIILVKRDTIRYINFYTDEIEKELIDVGAAIGGRRLGFSDYREMKNYYSEKLNALISTASETEIGVWYFDEARIEKFGKNSGILGVNYLEKSENIIFSDLFGTYLYSIEQKKVINQCDISGYNIVLSPDESLFAIQTYDYYEGSYIHIYSSLNMQKIKTFECNSYPCEASISSDNKFIAFTAEDWNIKVVEIETDNIIFDYDPIDILSQVFFCNSDKNLIAVNQYTGVTLVYDIETEEQVKTLVINDDETDILKLSDNGEYLVAYGYGYGRMKIINSETGNLEQLWVLSGAFGDNEFFQVDFHDDLILCCNQSKRIYLIDRFKGILGRYDMDEEIWDVAFAPDGNTFVSGSANGNLRVHNTGSGEVIKEIIDDNMQAVPLISYSDDPSVVYYISADMESSHIGRFYHWNLETNTLKYQNQEFYDIYPSRAKDIINRRYFTYRDYIFDLKEMKIIYHDFLEYYSANIDISDNGKYIAYGHNSNQEYFDLYNLENMEIAYRYSIKNYWKRVILTDYFLYRGIPKSICISPDNRYLYVGLNPGEIMKLKLKDTLGTDIAEEYNREGGLLAYPNPLTDRIIIENRADNKIITGLCLADIFGNEIVSKSANELYSSDNKIEINSLNLPAGTYFLIVRYSDGGQAVKKLIKY